MSRPELRIASFLPAATEMAYLLGVEDALVGVTHECDHPPAARDKPVLVDCALDLRGLSPGQIDAAVAERIRSGRSLYAVDEAKLRAAAPTLLVTQDLCQVCGPSGNEVSQVLKTLSPAPEVLWQTPKGFDGILEAVVEFGAKAGRAERARAWADQSRARVAAVAAKTAGRPRTRVAFLEWVEPVFAAGHWVPEMLAWAGGEDRNARAGQDSVRISWEEVAGWRPEVVIVAPCGFRTPKAVEQARALPSRPGWADLPAVRAGRVYAVDADAYFARPGPRVVDGVELLAHLLHPDAVAWTGPAGAYERVG